MSLQNNLTIVNADLADLQALHEIEELSFSGKAASLTCKQSLISFYEKLGYRNHGLSLSAVGGIKFYDMELDLLPFQTSGTA